MEQFGMVLCLAVSAAINPDSLDLRRLELCAQRVHQWDEKVAHMIDVRERTRQLIADRVNSGGDTGSLESVVRMADDVLETILQAQGRAKREMEQLIARLETRHRWRAQPLTAY